MNTIYKAIKSIAIIAMAGVLATACTDNFDVPPYIVPTYDGQRTNTIAELVAMHPQVGSYILDTIPPGTVISGTVISTDEYGNCYKYLTIQDETGGIQIQIDNSSLYTLYKIGQKIFVECTGLVIGDYGKLPQIGLASTDNQGSPSVGRISSTQLVNYLFKDGMPGSEPAASGITSISQLNNNLLNTLVKFENCSFDAADVGEPLATDNATTNRTLKISGGSVLVRTSNYATFRATPCPDGTGTVYGILTRFNNDFQLTLRSANDLQGFVSEQIVRQVDFSQNPLSNGWTNQQVSGSQQWSYINFDGENLLTIAGSGSANDCWLISPAYNFTSYSNLTLYFDHRVTVGTGSTNNMQLYYSVADPGGAFNAADWHPLSLTSFPSVFATSNPISLDSYISNPNLRIAFRYSSATPVTSQWTIKSIVFKSIN